MRHTIVRAGSAAIAVMVFYYLIPFFILAGAPDYVANLRLFLISGSVVLIALGLYQSLRMKQSEAPRSRLTVPLLWFSALVLLGLILSPQAIANLFANVLGG